MMHAFNKKLDDLQKDLEKVKRNQAGTQRNTSSSTARYIAWFKLAGRDCLILILISEFTSASRKCSVESVSLTSAGALYQLSRSIRRTFCTAKSNGYLSSATKGKTTKG
jgi:hypothetical protein